jgi:hypothetical protein
MKDRQRKKEHKKKQNRDTIKFSGQLEGFDFLVSITEEKNPSKRSIYYEIKKDNKIIECMELKTLKEWNEYLDLEGEKISALRKLKLMVESIEKSLFKEF